MKGLVMVQGWPVAQFFGDERGLVFLPMATAGSLLGDRVVGLSWEEIENGFLVVPIGRSEA